MNYNEQIYEQRDFCIEKDQDETCMAPRYGREEETKRMTQRGGEREGLEPLCVLSSPCTAHHGNVITDTKLCVSRTRIRTGRQGDPSIPFLFCSSVPATTTRQHKEPPRLYAAKINHRYTLGRASHGSLRAGIMEGGTGGEAEGPDAQGNNCIHRRILAPHLLPPFGDQVCGKPRIKMSLNPSLPPA